ncbi:uncharacterized protein LTR77_001155 [Saxophila tyrrhenica]|uniref:Lysine-specific metallo-endopeptidase domain-containing protein n=1 Tax=Saxophila tyrrhenica TaxID=1690608 RepID=A0AAV9PK14_9PEZI|nr:hypothetical protein LTR77_001155 [Saxophila tyrrhenica]
MRLIAPFFIATSLVGRIAHAQIGGGIAILTEELVVDTLERFFPDRDDIPTTGFGGCDASQVIFITQTVREVQTAARAAIDAIRRPVGEMPQVDNLYSALWALSDGNGGRDYVDAGLLVARYQSLLDLEPLVDPTRRNVIFHCDDKLFETLRLNGIDNSLQDHSSAGGCSSQAGGLAFTQIANSFFRQNGAPHLTGAHVVLCDPFFDQPSLDAVNRAFTCETAFTHGSVKGVENSAFGTLMHELAHALIGVPGRDLANGISSEVYGIRNALGYGQETLANAIFGDPSNIADNYHIFATLVLSRNIKFDWSNQGIAIRPVSEDLDENEAVKQKIKAINECVDEPDNNDAGLTRIPVPP